MRLVVLRLLAPLQPDVFDKAMAGVRQVMVMGARTTARSCCVTCVACSTCPGARADSTVQGRCLCGRPSCATRSRHGPPCTCPTTGPPRPYARKHHERPTPATALTAANYKSAAKPIWCPGCGNFTVLGAITRAMAQLQLPIHEVAVVSGIGCSSRIPAYTACYGFHGVHGRSLAAATGLKVARPELTVLVASGDGDGY